MCKIHGDCTDCSYCTVEYGVATVSSHLKIIGLFCTRALLKRRYSAKETYIFKEPDNRSHPISVCERWEE